MDRLDQTFFQHSAIRVARGLLGAVLQRPVNGVIRRARIVETEAYLGPRDLASHASKGLTRRTAVMFGPPGRAYVYLIYGLHTMLNVITGKSGEAQAVLIRAAEPLDGWPVDLTGPGRLAKHFAITLSDNGVELFNPAVDLHLIADPAYRPRVLRTARIGIDYAQHWKDRPLRFIDVRSPIAGKLKGVRSTLQGMGKPVNSLQRVEESAGQELSS